MPGYASTYTATNTASGSDAVSILSWTATYADNSNAYECTCDYFACNGGSFNPPPPAANSTITAISKI